MKKWSTITKKMTVLLLAAMLISAMMPGQARAQEESEQDDTEISVQSGDGAESDSAAADDTIGGDKAVQTLEVQDTGTEKEMKDSDNADDVESDGNGQDVIGKDDQTNQTDQSDDGQHDGQQAEDPEKDEGQIGDGQESTWPGGIPEITLDPMAFTILMDSSDKLYSGLSQFLALSSDKFRIYTVAVIDPVTQQPVQPDSPVEVSLDVPAGFDTGRVVVSEISMNGETPVRTELSFTYNNGKAVFETDHSGIYVVMEKKVQPQLPASLEMTSKVQKLELSKKYSNPNRLSLTASAGSLTVNPQTGDDNSVLIWGVVTVIAAVAVIALIVIVIKRRK